MPAVLPIVLLFVVAAFLPGCRKEAHARLDTGFAVEGLTAGEGPIGRNEPVVLRFSDALSDRPLPERAITVADDRGRKLPIAMSAEGHHLILRHRPVLDGLTADWPDTRFLDVRVPYPIAGSGFRSRQGAENSRRFDGRVRLLAGRLSRPGSLQLVGSFPESGARGIRFDPALEKQCDIVLDFNAPLDGATLDAGIQVVDLARAQVLEGVVKRIHPERPEQVLVSPFVKGLLFNGGTRFQVHVTADLRSRDGWAPMREEVIEFETQPGGQRLLHFGFSSPADFDERCRPAFNPDGMLRPRALQQPNIPPGNGRGLVSIVEGLDPRVPHVFSPLYAPSRSQILIPASWIASAAERDDRAHRFLITAIDFRADTPYPTETYVDDLVVTLGYLSQRRLGQGEGLDQQFDLNDDSGRRVRMVPLRGGPGRYRLAPEDPATTPMSSIVRLELAEPFLYDSTEGDLILGIHNSGAYCEVRSLGRGVGILGFGEGQNLGIDPRPYTLVLGQAGAVNGLVRSRFLPYVSVHTMQFPPVISRWRVVDDVTEPRFTRTPVAHAKTRSAREGVDFTVSYQSGDPVTGPDGTPVLRPDGTPECVERSGWDAYPPRDGGRAVRIKIDFEPRVYSPDDRLPEIEYLLVGYREP